ncbi:MAG: 2-succinyl-5-enolpyruvyl-6-hydroxy-3-cyclohexene-1-carboxylic-acid synthase [Chlorobiales bacterium]|nr:2-succinyl-5-enolpyruvyl-6-hydroxy-3-cyclohexene-1-carboxylic-acid synthase [Chlorobiales bacterium]
MNNREITTVWSTMIVEEVVRHGIRRFCISPGSRSTPLTAAAARNPDTECSVFPDERAAAFFALGHARSAGKPAALICTSGTAVANYFPAVVEASLDNQPMLVLSADRPFELLDTGANQTIRQQGIFRGYTRWNIELPEPSEQIPAAALLSTIDHAVRQSLGTPPGPVHLNLPFREPSDPVDIPSDCAWTHSLDLWKKGHEPLNRFALGKKTADTTTFNHVHELLTKASSPLLVAGHLDRQADAEAVLTLAVELQIPLYADISSKLRMYSGNEMLQPLFQSERFTSRFSPDLVIHFGGKIVGKQLPAAIKHWAPKNFIVIKNHPSRYNPDHNVTLQIEASPEDFAAKLVSQIDRTSHCDLPLRTVSSAIEKELDDYCSPDKQLTEISTARIVSKTVPQSHGLFLANSMPIRDMDSYTALRNSNAVPQCGMNRGASGIDGNIATAAGFAQGLGAPVTLVIGDISFLHDLNSLTLLRTMKRPLHIVVINNNGGGIFSFLPIAEQKDIFETHFGTPQSYSIRSAAETFGLAYHNPSTNREFRECYLERCGSNTSGIIEITCTREENLVEHRNLNARLRELIDRHL